MGVKRVKDFALYRRPVLVLKLLFEFWFTWGIEAEMVFPPLMVASERSWRAANKWIIQTSYDREISQSFLKCFDTTMPLLKRKREACLIRPNQTPLEESRKFEDSENRVANKLGNSSLLAKQPDCSTSALLLYLPFSYSFQKHIFPVLPKVRANISRS